MIFISASVAKAFHTDDGTIFDYVFNCAAETKLAQTEAVSSADAVSVDELLTFTFAGLS